MQVLLRADESPPALHSGAMELEIEAYGFAVLGVENVEVGAGVIDDPLAIGGRMPNVVVLMRAMSLKIFASVPP